MRRLLAVLATLAMIGALSAVATAGGNTKPAADPVGKTGANTAPLSHWCNTNGVTCAEPYQNWEDFSWFNKVEKSVNIGDDIGHDEPSLLFYSGQAGAGNDSVEPRRDGAGRRPRGSQHGHEPDRPRRGRDGLGIVAQREKCRHGKPRRCARVAVNRSGDVARLLLRTLRRDRCETERDRNRDRQRCVFHR